MNFSDFSWVLKTSFDFSRLHFAPSASYPGRESNMLGKRSRDEIVPSTHTAPTPSPTPSPSPTPTSAPSPTPSPAPAPTPAQTPSNHQEEERAHDEQMRETLYSGDALREMLYASLRMIQDAAEPEESIFGPPVYTPSRSSSVWHVEDAPPTFSPSSSSSASSSSSSSSPSSVGERVTACPKRIRRDCGGKERRLRVASETYSSLASSSYSSATLGAMTQTAHIAIVTPPCLSRSLAGSAEGDDCGRLTVFVKGGERPVSPMWRVRQLG